MEPEPETSWAEERVARPVERARREDMLRFGVLGEGGRVRGRGPGEMGMKRVW